MIVAICYISGSFLKQKEIQVKNSILSVKHNYPSPYTPDNYSPLISPKNWVY